MSTPIGSRVAVAFYGKVVDRSDGSMSVEDGHGIWHLIWDHPTAAKRVFAVVAPEPRTGELWECEVSPALGTRALFRKRITPADPRQWVGQDGKGVWGIDVTPVKRLYPPS